MSRAVTDEMRALPELAALSLLDWALLENRVVDRCLAIAASAGSLDEVRDRASAYAYEEALRMSNAADKRHSRR